MPMLVRAQLHEVLDRLRRTPGANGSSALLTSICWDVSSPAGMKPPLKSG